MNVNIVNDLEYCPECCLFCDIDTEYRLLSEFGKGATSVMVTVSCNHAETCKYRQPSDGDAHAS